MKDFRNTKIRVTPESSALVQEKFFESGVKWGEGSRIAQHIHEPLLEVSSYGILYYTRCEKAFQESGWMEITVEDVLGTKPKHKYAEILEAMIRGKEIEFLHNQEWKQKSQFDILHFMSKGIDTEYLRVKPKPKTKTIKQWEQKVYNKTKGKVITLVRDHENEFYNLDTNYWVALGKPYEKEYEVPDEN